MSSLAPVATELIITILSGPDKGAAYKLVSKKITLGRSTDSSIVIKDPRCSRHHANIELTNEGIIITDVSSAQKGIEVDGVLAKKAALKPGSKIVIGSTLIRFDIKSQNAQPPVSLPPLPNLQDSPAHIRQVVNPLPSASSRRSSSSSKTTFYIIVGAVAIGFALLLSGPNMRSTNDTPLRTDEMIEEEIKASQERKDAIVKQLKDKGVDTQEYSEVQSTYLQGFRDYREGNYARALLAFEAVLALNPKHELAFKYRELAKRRHDELIELTMLQGKRYMEQSKYAQAKNSYQQVMILIGDPKNKLYQEAREYYNECVLLMKGAF